MGGCYGYEDRDFWREWQLVGRSTVAAAALGSRSGGVYSQKHPQRRFCVNAASPSCPTDRVSLESWKILTKKGASKRSLKPEGRKKTTLSGTDPYRNPRRIPSSPEVRTDFHDLARLITRMRFHPNKDGHSDFCLKLHAGFRCAVSFHTMIFYCL